MLSLDVIENLEELKAFLPEWSEFAQTNARSTPFQTPAWQLTWWNHFGSGKLHVLCFRNHGRLCALLPLFLHRWNGRCQLTLIGTGISDYLDPLIDPALPPGEIATCLQSHLDSFAEWQFCDWQELDSETPLRSIAAAIVEPAMPCGETPLAGSFEEFWASRSKELRRNLRRYRERAEAISSIEFRVSASADPALMDALIRLHALRWESQGQPGMIQANHSEAFLRHLAVQMESAGLLRIFSVAFEDQIAALILTFVHHNTVFAYMSAFDPRHQALGLGRTLLYEAFRYAFSAGYRAWNFLRGDEPYKLSWGAQLSPRVRIKLEARRAP